MTPCGRVCCLCTFMVDWRVATVSCPPTKAATRLSLHLSFACEPVAGPQLPPLDAAVAERRDRMHVLC